MACKSWASIKKHSHKQKIFVVFACTLQIIFTNTGQYIFIQAPFVSHICTVLLKVGNRLQPFKVPTYSIIHAITVSQVIYYSTRIIESAKLDASVAQIGTIAMGSMNVAMTVISSLLVEAAGRKTLLLIGFGGMLIDTVLLTIALLLSVRNPITRYLDMYISRGFGCLFPPNRFSGNMQVT